jgi:hypothetical protein
MGIDCEWCRYWRREYDYVCQARLKLHDEARLEKDPERGHAIRLGIRSADEILAELAWRIWVHEVRFHPAVDNWA